MMNRCQRQDAGQMAGTVSSCEKVNGGMSSKVSLKDSLKTKILRNRTDKGLEDIRVDFAPKSPQPMTKAEKEKERRRKECNRKSADKSRKRAKEEKEENEKMLKEEKERKNELLYKERELAKQREIVLKRLRDIGVTENEIFRTLSAITCENKTLQSVNYDNDEDQRSVFYLTRSEESETYSETSASFSSENGKDVFQNGVCDTMTLCSDETLARHGVDTGYDVTNQDFGLDSSGLTDGGYQIVPANEVDLSQMAEGDVLTVIISYEDPKPPTPDEPTYTNL